MLQRRNVSTLSSDLCWVARSLNQELPYILLQVIETTSRKPVTNGGPHPLAKPPLWAVVLLAACEITML